MIIELEILEQISEENWPLHRAVEFIRKYKEPWQVLESLHHENCIKLLDKNQNSITVWQVLEILRNETEYNVPEVFVAITELGLKRAYE